MSSYCLGATKVQRQALRNHIRKRQQPSEAIADADKDEVLIAFQIKCGDAIGIGVASVPRVGVFKSSEQVVGRCVLNADAGARAVEPVVIADRAVGVGGSRLEICPSPTEGAIDQELGDRQEPDFPIRPSVCFCSTVIAKSLAERD